MSVPICSLLLLFGPSQLAGMQCNKSHTSSQANAKLWEDGCGAADAAGRCDVREWLTSIPGWGRMVLKGLVLLLSL